MPERATNERVTRFFTPHFRYLVDGRVSNTKDVSTFSLYLRHVERAVDGGQLAGDVEVGDGVRDSSF